MTTGQEIESILAVDAGSVTTKAMLVDLVDGVYRLVARGEETAGTSDSREQLLAGVEGIVQQMEAATGRQLWDPNDGLIMPEREDGQGVDALAVATSALPPLRVVIAGLIQSLSVEQARQAVEGAYAVVQDVVALDEGEQRWGASRGIEAKLEALCQNPPDVILLAGGVNGGAVSPLLDVAQILVALASVLEPPQRPMVILAGNEEARTPVAELLADLYPFRAVDNVMPDLETQALGGVQRELERLYIERGATRVPEIAELQALGTAAQGSAPLVSAAQAFGTLIRFVERRYNLAHGVLGVDLGGANAHLVAATRGGTRSLLRSDLGTSYGLQQLLSQVSIEEILRWLPFDMSADEARNRLLTRELYPASLPQSREDLFLEQAAAREALRLALAGLAASEQRQAGAKGLLPPLDMIIASGGALSHAANPGQAALLLLDALQPVGLLQLVLDPLGILPALGAVAAVQPLAAAQVLEQDGFLELGTVVAPVGAARLGDIALKCKMTYADGSTVQVDVPFGSLEVVPLPQGQTATLELRPTRRFDIGWGSKGRGGKIEVKGGAVGLIIDARGRPLQLAAQPTNQQARVQEWLWSMGG